MTKVPRRTDHRGATKTPTKKTFDPTSLATIFADFRAQKNTADAAAAEANRLRDEELMPALIKHGQAHGEKGQHLAIDLPDEVDGFVRLVRRTNTSRLLDIDAAEKLLKKKGLLEEAQVVSVMITGIPATQLDALCEAIAKLKLEKTFGVLPDIQTSFSQEAMYALHQRHRQELQELEEKGGKLLGARARAKYLLEDELDALVVEQTTYSFHPEKR